MRYMTNLLHSPAVRVLATAILWTGLSSAGVAQTANKAPSVDESGATSRNTLAATNLNSASAQISDQLADEGGGQSLNARLRQYPEKSTLGTGVWTHQCGAGLGCP